MMSVNRWYNMEIKKLNITDPWANMIISTEFIDIDILQNDMILSITVLIFHFHPTRISIWYAPISMQIVKQPMLHSCVQSRDRNNKLNCLQEC